MSEFTLIEASNGAKPKVVGVAYSGGKMNLPGWRHPVVVDLAGMEIPESVPLLTNHENKTDSRIGIISAAVRNNALEITGEIVSDSRDATDIIAQGKAGADWQLSIGADVKECELVKGSREVNGQEVEGPFYHIKKIDAAGGFRCCRGRGCSHQYESECEIQPCQPGRRSYEQQVRNEECFRRERPE